MLEKVGMKSLVITILLGLCCLATNGYPAFKDLGWGARPASMGGAFVALSDDVNATLCNPAGLVQIDRGEGTFMYAKPHAGLSDVDLGYNYFAYATNLKEKGMVGVSWASLSETVLYKEDIYSVSYARYMGKEKRISVGLNLKYLSRSINFDAAQAGIANDSVFASGNSKGGISVDAGVLVLTKNKLSLGVMIKNVNQPNLGFSETESVPMEIRVGAALRGSSEDNKKPVITPVVEVSSRLNETNLHFGGEIWFSQRNIGVRGGGITSSTGDLLEMEVGGSCFLSPNKTGAVKIGIDYGFISHFKLSSATHRIAMTAKF